MGEDDLRAGERHFEVTFLDADLDTVSRRVWARSAQHAEERILDEEGAVEIVGTVLLGAQPN